MSLIDPKNKTKQNKTKQNKREINFLCALTTLNLKSLQLLFLPRGTKGIAWQEVMLA